MDRLRGNVAIVTGAGRGIGQAIALRFAREGAKVAVVDIRGELAEQTARQISQEGGEGLPLHADVALNDEVNRFATKTVESFGQINILVNNAGIGGSKACLDTSEEDWDRMVAVNIKSIFLVCKRVIPELLRTGKGKIINIASMYGMFGSPHTAAYSASKAGVINLTRQLAVDYSSHNICINAISPGLIETEMTRHKVKDPRVLTQYLQSIPLGRHGTPDDVAGAAVFLASDDSDFITGHNLVVDGGQSCRIA
jgi:NAD(P)-dependent dehydrogenase (short-subunit alcohol dehydrogenase family)